MKSLIKILIASLVIICSISTIGYSKYRKIIVAVDSSFVPFEFKKGNKFVGFDIDLWTAIAKKIKINYRLVPMDLVGIIPALQTKNVHVALAGITITQDRKKVVDFSDSYYKSGLIVMVHSNENSIKNVNDLNGKIVAVKSGTSAANYAKQHLKTKELRQFPSIDDAYMELSSNRADAVLNDVPNILYFIKTAGKGHFKTVGNSIEAQEYGIAFPKGSKLREEVNKALKILHKDGTYDAIYKKWFNTNIK